MTDPVERQEAIKLYTLRLTYMDDIRGVYSKDVIVDNEQYYKGYEDEKKADIEQIRRGEWVKLYEGNYKCSECGSWWACDKDEIKEFKYCPNCGARME